MEWIQPINKAITYIEEHLSEDIRGEDIARHVHISLFHFQRTFNLLTGMTVGEYIRKRRLSLAGEELTREGTKVVDVALKYGYESPESFSKAFTRFHGITPNQAGKGMRLKSFNKMTLKISIEGGLAVDYRIEKMDSFSLIVYSGMFTEENAAVEIPAFWSAYFQKKMDEKIPGNVGICFQDSLDAKEFMYGIGCFSKDVLKDTDETPTGFRKVVIPKHSWAIFPCVGAMPDAIRKMWKFIYGEWLPGADYELIPDYDMENYLPGDKNAPDYISEIWIPVKESAGKRKL